METSRRFWRFEIVRSMSAKINLVMDSLVFIASLVALEPGVTGVMIHEWLSLALASTLVLHINLHWDWMMMVTAQFLHRLFNSSRLNYVINFAFFAGVVVMLSGIMISRSVMSVLGIQITASQTWCFLHNCSANLALILVGVHFTLHWKWIVSTFRRSLVAPQHKRFTLAQLRAPIVVQNNDE
jgi:hypothetical protein